MQTLDLNETFLCLHANCSADGNALETRRNVST